MKNLFLKTTAITLLLCMTAGLFGCNTENQEPANPIVINEIVTERG